MVQLVKNPPAMQETWVWSLGWEDPLEKGTATHSNILAWRIPWTVWPMELQSVGHNWVTFTFLNNNNVRLEKQNLNAKMFLTYFSQGLSEQMIPGTMLGSFKYVASFPLSYPCLLLSSSYCPYSRTAQGVFTWEKGNGNQSGEKWKGWTAVWGQERHNLRTKSNICDNTPWLQITRRNSEGTGIWFLMWRLLLNQDFVFQIKHQQINSSRD